MRCLVWTADVTLRDGSLEWDQSVVNPEVLPRVLPQVARLGDTWERTLRTRVPEDARRADETARQAILAGEPSYAEDVRHVDWYGDMVWLHEDVVIDAVGENCWRLTGTVSEITKRRRAEDQLRAVIAGVQCLLWHAKVTDHAGELHWHVDPVDEAVAERFLPVDLHPGEAWHEAVNRSRRPEDVPRMERTSRNAIRSGAPRYSQEYPCVDRDGMARWLHEEVFIEPDGPDRWRLVGVTMDVTDRRHAENALRQSEQQARLIADSLPVLISYVDTEERYVFCNRAYNDWFGWDTENIPGTPVRDAIGETLYQATRDGIQAALAGERVRFDFEMPGGEEGPRDADCLYVPDIADDGSVRGFMALVTDVTERQRAIRDVRDSEAHLRAIMDGAVDGIITMDAQGRIASLNPTAADMFGYDRDELLGSDVSTMMPAPDGRSGGRYVEGYLRAGEATAVGTRREVQGRRKDGTTFPASMSIGKVLLEGRRLYACVVRDITEQKAMRDELIGLNADLEQRVEDRTAALAREAEQHRATARALEDGENQRTQLMDRMLAVQEEERARIARELHDQVGQELTSVLIGLRVIESAETTEDATRQATELRKVTSSTLEDIRQIAFDMRPSSLDDLGLETALRRDLGVLAKNAGFTANLHIHNPDGLSASTEMEVGLYRLAHTALTNVVRHAEAQAVTVALQMAHVEGDHIVSLLVEDDGVGFDDEAVFAGPVEGRFGLLSMQERARMVGGRVTVESTPGEGATVLIEIPLADRTDGTPS